MKLTEEIYQQCIPDCCSLRTVWEHNEYLMLCWGLANDIRASDDPAAARKRKCGRECEYHKNHDPVLLKSILAEATSK